MPRRSVSFRNEAGKSGFRLPNTDIPLPVRSAEMAALRRALADRTRPRGSAWNRDTNLESCSRRGTGCAIRRTLDSGETRGRTHLQPLLRMAISAVPERWGPHPQELLSHPWHQ
jgi:hypothetical protein